MGKTFSTGLLTDGIAQDSSNNIGIGGAVNASYKLAVTGATTITGNLGVGGGANERLTITGPSGLAGMARWTDATTGSAFLGFTSGGTAYIHSNSGVLSFGANGSNNFAATMTLTSGNVGIGTTSPSSYAGANLVVAQSTSGNMGISIDNTYTSTNAGTASVFLYNGGLLKVRYDYARDLDAGIIGTVANIPMLYFAGGSERMRITSGGQVGIGTTSPSYTLDVQVNNSTFTTRIRNLNTTTDSAGLFVQAGVNAGNEVAIFRNAAGSDRMTIFANGNVVVNALGTGLVYSNSGVLTSTNPSDSRLKDNIEDLQYGLADILKLRPVKYNWKDDKINQGLQFGFIAQEVKEIMPDAIKEFGEDVKYLGLEKDAIYATLVKAIQEQNQTIEELKDILTRNNLS